MSLVRVYAVEALWKRAWKQLTMKWLLRVFVLAAAALAIVAAPNGAWAGNQGGGQGGGGKGGSHHSGGQRSGAGGGLHTRFHGGFVGGSFWYSYYASPFYFYEPRPFYYYGGGPPINCYGPPPYCYGPPPYYYGPDYSKPRYDPPTVYVEKFEDTPTLQTQGEIFCPDRGAYYPDVKDCPNGWQQVFQASAATD